MAGAPGGSTSRRVETAAFIAAGAAFLWGSHCGISIPELLALLGVYLMFGLLWARGQLRRASLGDLTPYFGRELAWILLGLGLLGVISYLLLAHVHCPKHPGPTAVCARVRPHDVVLIVGAAVAYVAAGSLVMTWRLYCEGETDARSRTRAWAWMGILASPVLVYVLAHQLPGGASKTVRIAILVVLATYVLIVVPIATNLVTGRRLNRLGAAGCPWPAGLYIGVGAAVAIGCLVTIGVTSGYWKATIALSALLAVVIVSIVSDTQFDVVVAIAVIGLIGATRPEVTLDSVHQPWQSGSAVLVSFGDSYMSGEGAKVFFKGTDTAGGNECRRAPTAWAALAVGPNTPYSNLAFLACSGARATNVDDGGTPQGVATLTQVPQYEAMQRAHPFTPTLAVVSLGGNDAGFSSIGMTCLAPGNCRTQSARFDNMLPYVAAQLHQAYADIKAALPGVPVVAVPYPIVMTGGASCADTTLPASERRFIVHFLVALDNVVRTEAAMAHFWYLGAMKYALSNSHEELCDPQNFGNAGVNFIHLASMAGIADERFNPASWIHDSLHPNALGHKAMLATFRQWLAAHPHLKKYQPNGLAPPLPTSNSTCDASPGTDNNCLTEATNWAVAQVVGRVLPQGLLPLGLVTGLWILSVGLLGALRRRWPGPTV